MTDAVARCRRVLAAGGLDPHQPVERATSYANEVWLTPTFAVRINHPGLPGASTTRLHREAAIAARLPASARYPRLIASGLDGEVAWSITERVAGQPLGRAWAALDRVHRRGAIVELAGALAAVHATPIAGIDDDVAPPHTLPLAPLLALVDSTAAEPALLAAVRRFVLERWSAFDDPPATLVHGDPHLENVLWDGERVSALLDLEWARPSWPECDLEILLAVAATPARFAAPDHEATVHAADYAELPGWLAAARPDWFAHPRLLDRLDVLHVSRTLGVLADGGPSPVLEADLRAALAGASPVRRLAARARATSA